MNTSSNKRIAINTSIIYIRLAIVTIVSLITTRYSLQILGVSDYGLFNVVGSIISLLNCLSTAMHTTTRRFINVEMGKTNGNLNRIFNVCLILHILFAIFILLICESIGIWYINNYLNILPEKLQDAIFVFHITTIVSCIGIINVPFQGLIEAYEKFWQTASVDVINVLLKLLFILTLTFYAGPNTLQLYAIMLSFITFLSFILYHIICYRQWKDIIKFKIYKNLNIYKDILIFNNYTALGAFVNLSRIQGCNILINLFFGTVINASFSIAYQIQYFVQLLSNNLGSASAPQITQKYSKGNKQEAIALCSNMNRYTILITTTIIFALYVKLETILIIWLKKIPDGCLPLCQWILICAIISSFSTPLSTYIQATGKIKWFQIIGSIVEFTILPISYIYLKNGYPPVTIIIILSIITFIGKLINLILMHYIINFNSLSFVKDSCFRPVIIITLLSLWVNISNNKFDLSPIVSIIYTIIISLLCLWFIGINNKEREFICNRLNNYL